MESQPSNHKDQGDQGALFDVHTTASGATDPELQNYQTVYTPVEGGVYPEGQTPSQDTPQNDGASEAVRSAAHSHNRHMGQLGKHSPLERTGSYSKDLKPGDFLPGGFGVVTHTNFNKAQQFAQELDTKRQQKRQQP